jgi:transcriptional regulator with XRE-family HTH domain
MDWSDETISERVGRLVKDLRRSTGMNQEELGLRVGHTNGSPISKLERGQRKDILLTELLAIGEVCGVDSHQVITMAVDYAEGHEARWRDRVGTSRPRSDERAVALLADEVIAEVGPERVGPLRRRTIEGRIAGLKATLVGELLPEGR